MMKNCINVMVHWIRVIRKYYSSDCDLDIVQLFILFSHSLFRFYFRTCVDARILHTSYYALTPTLLVEEHGKSDNYNGIIKSNCISTCRDCTSKSIKIKRHFIGFPFSEPDSSSCSYNH